MVKKKVTSFAHPEVDQHLDGLSSPADYDPAVVHDLGDAETTGTTSVLLFILLGDCSRSAFWSNVSVLGKPSDLSTHSDVSVSWLIVIPDVRLAVVRNDVDVRT